MGNDLNATREKIKKEIEDKILNTGHDQLCFTNEQMKTTRFSCTEIHKKLLEEKNELTLPILFQMFHYAKQLEMNQHCSMTDVFYFEPLLDACRLQRFIDKKQKNELQELPLLGFVFSIKELFKIKNSRSTWGLHEFINRIYNENAPIFDYLRKKGGLISCKGNIPQMMMAIDSSNNIYGYCSNPHNNLRVSGGSSGGDAAAVGLGLVNVAIGTDVGGSVRIPALYCGIYGFKPTAKRVEYLCTPALYFNTPDYGKSFENQFVFPWTIGPMALSAKDCTAVTKVLCEFSMKSTECPPLPWKIESNPKRVAVIAEYSSFLKLPTVCSRALDETVSILQKAGVEIVPIDIGHLILEIATNTMSCFFHDKELFSVFEESGTITETLIEAYDDTIKLARCSLSTLKRMEKSDLVSPREKVIIRGALKAKTGNQLSLMIQQTEQMRKVIRIFEEANVDVAICHGLFPAPYLKRTEGLNYALVCTAIWNYLNFPVGVVPITKVKENEQYFEPEVNDKIDEILIETMAGSKGLPIGIQVVGLPWRDELVLKTMELIEENLPKEK